MAGTEYLHSNDILHRDIAPRNVLIGLDCQVKLADFGLATKLISGDGKTEANLSQFDGGFYQAPELVSNLKYL